MREYYKSKSHYYAINKDGSNGISISMIGIGILFAGKETLKAIHIELEPCTKQECEKAFKSVLKDLKTKL